MRNKIIIISLLIFLTVSGYFNFSLAGKENQEKELLLSTYRHYVIDFEALYSGLKDQNPLHYYMFMLGKTESRGELLQAYYRKNDYAPIFTDVPNDLMLLFTRAYESKDKIDELIRLLEIHQIIAKHLKPDVFDDPHEYHYAYLSAQSEIRERKLIDEETMTTLLGW